MKIDGFLVIEDSTFPVVGESQDQDFVGKGAMEISSFTLRPANQPTNMSADKAKESNFAMLGSDDDGLGALCMQFLFDEVVDPTPLVALQSFVFTVKKDADLATPDLFKAFCRFIDSPENCQPYDEAFVTLRKAGQSKPVPFLEFHFKGVYVVDYKLKVDSGEKPPSEDVDFAFDYCEMTYHAQSKSGAKKPLKPRSFDFKTTVLDSSGYK